LKLRSRNEWSKNASLIWNAYCMMRQIFSLILIVVNGRVKARKTGGVVTVCNGGS
jgi:hypothetical protein